MIAGRERVILSSEASIYTQACTHIDKLKYTLNKGKGMFVFTVIAKRRVREEGEQRENKVS